MDRNRFMKDGKASPESVFGPGGVYEAHAQVRGGKSREPLMMGTGASANPMLAAMMQRIR